jgi:hypothetical protein
MGECATYKGEYIKIGTCENMYYLRYEDRLKVENPSFQVATEANLFWRLPFPDEDEIGIGHYEQHNKGLRLWREIKTPGTQPDSHLNFEDSELEPGKLQMSHKCGYLMSVPCYHGFDLPDNCHWNGKGWFLELAFIKNTSDKKLHPVVRCKHCQKMWRYEWDDILEYTHGKMRTRLEKYSNV